MDASMAFPCFDQPDLKGRFKLTITAPPTWAVISNTAPTGTVSSLAATTTFAETEPIPTYLFAFAAGPFVNVRPQAGMPNVWVRKSKAQAAESEVPAVQTTATQGIQFLSDYFAQRFPFPKYEMVLIPGFAYGGMEHAGCTFLREESVVFRTAPTDLNRLNRQVLVLHELTHQWFGDFVTMRWFDDLWLKEGFAQYMAYKTLAALRPNDDIWQHFYQSIKPAAYAIDETQGTTPIYQEIRNLDSAKSAYGAIVYSKAPGVLRQLNYVIGDDAFQKGLQLYLAAHKYGNATWSDLIGSFQQASGRNLNTWADMWIRHRGMPRVDVAWSCSNSRVASLRLTQTPVLGGNEVWPIATEIALAYSDGSVKTLRAELDSQSIACPFAQRHPQHAQPGCSLTTTTTPTASSHSTRNRAMSSCLSLPVTSPPRSTFSAALYYGDRSGTRSAKPISIPPSTQGPPSPPYTRRPDESLAASLLSHTETAIHRYLSPAATQNLLARGTSLDGIDRMLQRPQPRPAHCLVPDLPAFAASGFPCPTLRRRHSESVAARQPHHPRRRTPAAGSLVPRHRAHRLRRSRSRPPFFR